MSDKARIFTIKNTASYFLKSTNVSGCRFFYLQMNGKTKKAAQRILFSDIVEKFINVQVAVLSLSAL